MSDPLVKCPTCGSETHVNDDDKAGRCCVNCLHPVVTNGSLKDGVTVVVEGDL